MMRRPIISDVMNMARVLAYRPGSKRADVLARAIRECGIAEAFRRENGKPHPRFGDGTLSGWANSRPKTVQSSLQCGVFTDCLIQVLAAWRTCQDATDQPAVQETQRRAVRSSRKRPKGMSSPQSSHAP